MNKSLMNKLCLGTAQFGIDYGITNKRGMIPKEEAFGILEYAHDAGIRTLDSASSYGESEAIIGRFMAKTGKVFDLFSKTPHFDAGYSGVRKGCDRTLKSLGLPKINGYLVHGFKDIVNFKPRLWDDMVALKKEGLACSIGVSVYMPEELKYLRDEGISADIVQLPYSIFDRRFESELEALKRSETTVFARSVFLQGLAFMEPSELTGGLLRAAGNISALRKLSNRTGLSINAICLNFALTDSRIDKVVIGVDSIEHLKKNLDDIIFFEDVKKVYGEIAALKIEEEEILLPYKWGNR